MSDEVRHYDLYPLTFDHNPSSLNMERLCPKTLNSVSGFFDIIKPPVDNVFNNASLSVARYVVEHLREPVMEDLVLLLDLVDLAQARDDGGVAAPAKLLADALE